MVTDRVGPTITTLKAEVDYLGAEVNKLLNLLADERTESMRLRAEIERLCAWNAEIALNARHFAEALRKIADHPTGGVGCNPEGFVKDARAALEGK